MANIPYYLTTDLMTMLITSEMPIQSISVMVQKEAAEKMAARPGDEGYGMLSVRAQYAYAPEIALDVPACLFTPPPKVDSAFIIMPRREKPAVDVMDEKLFFRVAAAAFAMRRKTMENNLISSFRVSREKAGEWMEKSGLEKGVHADIAVIDPRPLQDFAALADTIKQD